MENRVKVYKMSGFRVLEYEEAGSTNTVAAALRGEERKDKTVVLTHRQVAGRGQGENRWECEPGKNISLSVILCPEKCEASRQFAVSMVIALGCRDFVSRYVPSCTVKWPNDVYVGDKKIAGILIEHSVSGIRIAASVCGIGLNVNQRRFLSDAPNPVSLYQLTEEELDIQQAVEELLGCIGNRYRQLDDYAALEHDYLKGLYRREGVYAWEDRAGVFRAMVEGVDEYGRLVLKDTEGRKRTYGFKEVKFC